MYRRASIIRTSAGQVTPAVRYLFHKALQSLGESPRDEWDSSGKVAILDEGNDTASLSLLRALGPTYTRIDDFAYLAEDTASSRPTEPNTRGRADQKQHPWGLHFPGRDRKSSVQGLEGLVFFDLPPSRQNCKL